MSQDYILAVDPQVDDSLWYASKLNLQYRMIKPACRLCGYNQYYP